MKPRLLLAGAALGAALACATSEPPPQLVTLRAAEPPPPPEDPHRPGGPLDLKIPRYWQQEPDADGGRNGAWPMSHGPNHAPSEAGDTTDLPPPTDAVMPGAIPSHDR